MTAPKLTAKQARFAEEFMADLNASAAARRAGYSAHTAPQQGLRLLSNPQVCAAIARQQEMASQRAARTVDDVLSDLAAVRRNAMELVNDPDTGTKTMRNHREALRALELEGKRLGAFDDRLRLMGHDGGPVHPVTRIEIVARPLSGSPDGSG